MKIKNLDIEEVKKVVREVKSGAEARRRLNLYLGAETRLRHFLVKNGIDHSHWTGQLWSKGKTAVDEERINSDTREEIFTENSKAAPSSIRKYVEKYSLLEKKCVLCGLTDIWNGKRLNLQLDHINGIRSDQRLENLRYLCPNCHSQTDTYCSKNKKKRSVSDKELEAALKESDSIHAALKKIGMENGQNYYRALRVLDKMYFKQHDENLKLRNKEEKALKKNEKKARTLENRKNKRLSPERIALYEAKILEVNPEKFGWVMRAARNCGVSHAQIRRVVQRFLPHFLKFSRGAK